jgi:hypothetical protein
MQSRFLQTMLAAPPAGCPERSRHAVLGFRLHRLTLWHLIALRALLGERDSLTPASFSELAVAVTICRTAPRRMARRIRGLKRWTPLRMRVAGWALAHHIKAWDAYVADFSSMPTRQSSARFGTPLSSPWALALASQLVRFGIPRQEALYCTPAEARWWVAGLREAVGENTGIASAAVLEAARKAGYHVED